MHFHDSLGKTEKTRIQTFWLVDGCSVEPLKFNIKRGNLARSQPMHPGLIEIRFPGISRYARTHTSFVYRVTQVASIRSVAGVTFTVPTESSERYQHGRTSLFHDLLRRHWIYERPCMVNVVEPMVCMIKRKKILILQTASVLVDDSYQLRTSVQPFVVGKSLRPSALEFREHSAICVALTRWMS